MPHDDRRPLGQGPNRGADRAPRFVLLATAAFFLLRLPVLPHRIFDPDEFEHAHAAWCFFKGMIPYKDFFEHHTPWYYYVLRPFFHWFDVDTSFDSARHFLLFGRGLSLLLAVLSVLLVCRIGRLWNDRRVGPLAALFLVAQPIFLQKSVEMRPDMLALPFFLGGLWFLLRGFLLRGLLRRGSLPRGLAGRGTSATRGLGFFVAGGLGFGAAIMCTQKMLFVLPGTLAGLGVWALSAGGVGNRLAAFSAVAGRSDRDPADAEDDPRARILLILAVLVGICVPATLTWLAFSVHHAGRDFIANNFLVNASWKHTRTGQLLKLLETSWPVMTLSLLGLVVSLHRFFRHGLRRPGELLLACALLGLFAGILVIPVAQRQYYLMPLPLFCLFAAQGMLVSLDRLRVEERTRTRVFLLAMIPLAVLPGLALLEAFTSPNDGQLARLRFVLESTRPTDVVMDGWEGTGVFRLHAFYYFFLHNETLPMLPPERVSAYLDALESGRIRPKLIAMDAHLVALGPRFLGFVNSNYASRDGFFYFRTEGIE